MRSFRPFVREAEDYAFATRVLNAHHPDLATTPDELRREDTHDDPAKWREDYFIEGDSGPIGLLYLSEPRAEDAATTAEAHVYLDPAFDNDDDRRAAYAFAAERAIATGRHRLVSIISSEWTEHADTLSRLGASPTMRFPMRRLDLAEFDASPFDDLQSGLREAGFRIVSLAELDAGGVAWERPRHELASRLLRDVPAVSPVQPTPFDVWVREMRDPEMVDLRLSFVAIAPGGEFVGMTGLALSDQDPTRAETGLTGVIREFRRRGLATALKVACLDAARRQGITRIVTDNEENNPMGQLNAVLGFRRVYDWVEYRWDAPGATG